MYNICPNSENFLLYLKFEFIWFSLLGMSDKLDFLEGEKKGKASSQDPKKAVNKKGWVDLLSIQNWKLVSGSFSLLSLSYCEGISGSWSKLWKATRHQIYNWDWQSWLCVWCHRCIQLQLHHVMQIYFWADLLVWHSSFSHLSIWWRLHNKSLKNCPLCILTVPTQRGNTRTKGLASEARKAARSGTPKRATTTSPASEPRSPTDAEPKEGRRAKEAIKMWVTFTNCVYDYLMNFVF